MDGIHVSIEPHVQRQTGVAMFHCRSSLVSQAGSSVEEDETQSHFLRFPSYKVRLLAADPGVSTVGYSIGTD